MEDLTLNVLSQFEPTKLFGELLKQNNDCDTIVHYAASHDRVDIINKALQRLKPEERLNVLKVQNSSNATPLMRAVTAGSKKTFEEMLYLLSFEENVKLLSTRDEFGCTAIHLAVGCNEEIIECLRKYFSTKDKTAKWVELLKIVDDDQRTAVHFAAEKGQAELIGVLLRDLSPQQCFEVLKIQGSENEGSLRTAFHTAANGEERFFTDCIVKMFHCVTDPTFAYNLFAIQDSYGETFLYRAVKREDDVAIARILKMVAHEKLFDFLSLKSCSGDTALHLASFQDYVKGIKRMMEVLAVNEQTQLLESANKGKLIPLAAARDRNNTAAVNCLQMYGKTTEKLPQTDSEKVAAKLKEDNLKLKKQVRSLAGIIQQLRVEREDVHNLQENSLAQAESVRTSFPESDDDVLIKQVSSVIRDYSKRLHDKLADKEKMCQETEKSLREKVKKAKLKVQGLKLKIEDLEKLNKDWGSELTKERELNYGFRKDNRDLFNEKQEHNKTITELCKDIAAKDIIIAAVKDQCAHQLQEISEMNRLRERELEEKNSSRKGEIEKESLDSKTESKKTAGGRRGTAKVGKDADSSKGVKSKKPVPKVSGIPAELKRPKEPGNDCAGISSSDGSDFDDEQIPRGLVQQIKRLCSLKGITNYILLQNPLNLKNIAIMGKNTNNLDKADLEKFSQEFEGYTIFASKQNERTHTRQLMWRNSFRIERFEVQRDGTCELIVQATAIGNNGERESVLYAVGPGHMLFSEEQNRNLMVAADILALRGEVRQQEGRQRKVYQFRSGSEHEGNHPVGEEIGGVVVVPTVHPPLFGYRYNYAGTGHAGDNYLARDYMEPKDEAVELEHDYCLNDTVLLRFDEESAREVQTKLQHYRHTRREQLVKIGTWNKLRQYNRPQKWKPNDPIKIVVKNFSGHLCNNFHTVAFQRSAGVAHHLLFRLDEGELCDGDSGSIVFKVRDGGNHYPLGMLIGEAPEIFPDPNADPNAPPIRYYQALILQQAFKDLQVSYEHDLMDIKLYTIRREEVAFDTDDSSSDGIEG